MYERYCKLRDLKQVKDADVARETGITKSTFSDWKNGKYTPKREKLQKLSDYFGVSIDYLTTGEEPSTIEMAQMDVNLTNMKNKVKQYALKLDALSEKDQEMIMQMIDRCKDN